MPEIDEIYLHNLSVPAEPDTLGAYLLKISQVMPRQLCSRVFGYRQMGYIVIWKGKKNVLEKFVLKYNENNIIHMVISVIESCEKRFLYCLYGIIAFMAFIAVLS